MGIEQLYSMYSPVGDMIAFVTCVVLLVVISTVLYFEKETKFVFLKRSLHYILVGSMTNIIFEKVCLHYPIGGDSALYNFLIFGLRSIYHICFMCCLYLFILYIKKMLDVKGKSILIITYITRAFFWICLVMDVLSPLTKFGFHKVGDLWYDPLVSPYNGFYVYGLLIMFIMMFFYSKRIIKSVRFCLIITELIVVTVMLRGAIHNTNTITSFSYVIPIIVVMILLHSRPFDDLTGAVGVEGFDSFVSSAIKQNIAMDYLVLKLNTNLTGRIPTELGKALNAFWFNYFKNAHLFSIEHDLFVLVIPRISKNGETEEKIAHLLENEFKHEYSVYQIQYKVIGLYNVDFIQDEKDIKDMINYLLYTMSENTMLIMNDELRERLKLIRAVRKNLSDIEQKANPNDERVLAYCQPIRNMKTGKYDTAEALMRLQLDSIGIIPPNVFIPLAEYYGHIHALSKIMVNKVSKQIKELETNGYEFSRISINFAASEIKQENFCEELIQIIEDHGINPSHIGIEMTESQTESDFKIVKEKMMVLKDRGMTIYLDDVGTGYSNLDRIVKYDIDVVKFDRFFLLEAEKNENVVYMIKHLSEAFRDLNYKLLYEGVETEEHENLCLNCGADYIQGFKYSKPVPIKEIANFFEKG